MVPQEQLDADATTKCEQQRRKEMAKVKHFFYRPNIQPGLDIAKLNLNKGKRQISLAYAS